MFKKLHLKLTFTNALILICFLFMFSYSIVGISSMALDRTSENSLRQRSLQLISLSKSLDSFELVVIDDRNSRVDGNILGNVMDIHHVIWNNNKKLSTLNIVDGELINVLFDKALNTFKNKDEQFKIIKANGLSYRMYSQYYELPSGRGGVIQIFQSREVDNYILNQLFVVIMIIGSVSIGILIFISSYLAKKSLEPVRLSYERQKEFIADASHELRTPLTIMRTNLDLLSMKENETIIENKKWFDNIYSETETMAKLVHNLLTLAQVDNNQVNTRSEIVDLSVLTQKTCDKLVLMASEKDISFKSIIADNVMVKGDVNRLEQLIVILIDNAIKYTTTGGEILVSLMTTPEKAYLSVKDNGVGISNEDREKIFERFYRVDKVRSREQGGVGLGLNIAKWIIADHKGTIEIKSKLGKGSEFIVGLNKKNR
ncbi:hypothetical protein GC105_03645 [Alkalibaculum sp. M08DMB]|uniref:histidine kinase n=1 Tax=Alkalibaculum sporogenes TaxID=2655001 RepID=A0A6A7K6Z0_9FIRM|nr:ATP-binding protein [Alkalibaculum sporogenes]MPW24883.1 hypothetical protein [Alkalibaculum sporogenes]